MNRRNYYLEKIQLLCLLVTPNPAFDYEYDFNEGINAIHDGIIHVLQIKNFYI